MKQDMQQLMREGMNYAAIPGLKFHPKLYDVSWRKDMIIDLVCDYFKISRGQLFDKTRRRTIAMARHLTIHFLYKHTGLSKIEIAKLSGQDHTTILHVLKKTNRPPKYDENLHQKMREIENRIFL